MKINSKVLSNQIYKIIREQSRKTQPGCSKSSVSVNKLIKIFYKIIWIVYGRFDWSDSVFS